MSINTSPDRGGTESLGASFAPCYDLVLVGDSLGSAILGIVLAWPQRIEDLSSHSNIKTLGLGGSERLERAVALLWHALRILPCSRDRRCSSYC
jgi:hypothetical protein